MQYVRVYTSEDGALEFEDVELPTTPRHVVEGVPPLLLSQPFPVAVLAEDTTG